MLDLMCNPPALPECSLGGANNENMLAVLAAIRNELSLDPARSKKQVTQRLYELNNVVKQLAKSLETAPERLTVGMVVENEGVFLDYLAQSAFSDASKQALRTSRNTVLRYARACGFSRASFKLLDEWEPILAVLPTDHGICAITKDAILRKRRPGEFSETDLAVWANATLDAGRDYSYVRQAKSAFLAAIRRAGLQSSLPMLDLSVRRLPGYRLRVAEMPEPVRATIIRMVNTRRAEAEISESTQSEIIENFEYFCGYAQRVCGIDIEELDLLLNEPFVMQYGFWLHKERKCTRATVVGRLSRMFAALGASPEFEGRDFRWISSIYRRLRPEPESALRERRRQREIAFQDLASIPERMRAERTARRDESPKSMGWLIHDELLLSCMILAQYPPRFIREAVLGKNIFKGQLPKKGPPFKVPAWANDLVSRDPNSTFWQFSYQSKEGRLYRGLVLRQIVPLLEHYLEFRPRLVGGAKDEGNVFLNRMGHPLSCYRLGQHVNDLTVRYTGKRVSPKAIQSSFAYRWREVKGPEHDAMLSTIQWIQYPTIKMRYDEEFRKQRRVRVNRRTNPYS